MIQKISATQTKTKLDTKLIRKGRRRHSRELAMQGLYQWCVAGGTIEAIEEQLHETKEFLRTDQKYFSDLMHGVLKNLTELKAHIQVCLDRPLKELSPVELAILLLSTYEFTCHLEIPYRAIINEAVELAKAYGGTDGYKYVNGVLDKLAIQLRAEEVSLHVNVKA